jgi:hypothetical protein
MRAPCNRTRLATGMAIVLFLFGAVTAHADDLDHASDYAPGQGWHLPGTDIGIGGYGALSYANFEDDVARFAVDDISLFLHWESEGRLRAFAELGLETPLVATTSGHYSSPTYVSLERAYIDYLYADSLNLRLGKFLTPIGRWNVIHADPLVWTTSRPLITEQAFPTNVTGIMLFGTSSVFGHAIDYSAYATLGSEWRPNPDLDPFSEAYGAHVSTALTPNSELGASLVSFEQRSSVGERRKLIGLDYMWSRNRFEISAEAAYRFSDDGSLFDEKGLFVQGVVPLSARLYAVGRYEFYDPAGNVGADLNLWVLGLAFRPNASLVLKMEARTGGGRSERAPESVQASVAFLF